jgi:cobalt-zinc-cadmium resistance protein CzcA
MIGSTTSNGGIASASDRFTGIQAGISLPLFFGSYKAKIKQSKLKAEIAETNADYNKMMLQSYHQQYLNELLKHKSSLNYYEVKAVPQADVIIENANKSFTNGAIDYIEYIQAMNQALEIKSNYLNTLNNYNQAVINLEYLINQ